MGFGFLRFVNFCLKLFTHLRFVVSEFSLYIFSVFKILLNIQCISNTTERVDQERLGRWQVPLWTTEVLQRFEQE